MSGGLSMPEINSETLKIALEATLIVMIAFCIIVWIINFRKGGKG